MKLIKYLLKLKAPRIVYVSCNPATLARDLDYLCHGVVCILQLVLLVLIVLHGKTYAWDYEAKFYQFAQTEQGISGCYSLKSVQPVDMFPHTPHIECVCLLELSWLLAFFVSCTYPGNQWNVCFSQGYVLAYDDYVPTLRYYMSSLLQYTCILFLLFCSYFLTSMTCFTLLFSSIRLLYTTDHDFVNKMSCKK